MYAYYMLDMFSNKYLEEELSVLLHWGPYWMSNSMIKSQIKNIHPMNVKKNFICP